MYAVFVTFSKIFGVEGLIHPIPPNANAAVRSYGAIDANAQKSVIWNSIESWPRRGCPLWLEQLIVRTRSLVQDLVSSAQYRSLRDDHWGMKQ
jgi:hypothetical protein